MELFQKALRVRLCHYDKYLFADEDCETVSLSRDSSSRNVVWTIEMSDGGDCYLRFKSCFEKYLTASNHPFVPGVVVARKVVQAEAATGSAGWAADWEPLRDGFSVRLRTRHGHFLRANGGLPPWRNSVTHVVPYWTRTQEKILWDIDIVEMIPRSPTGSSRTSVDDSSNIEFPQSKEPPLIGPVNVNTVW